MGIHILGNTMDRIQEIFSLDLILNSGEDFLPLLEKVLIRFQSLLDLDGIAFVESNSDGVLPGGILGTLTDTLESQALNLGKKQLKTEGGGEETPLGQPKFYSSSEFYPSGEIPTNPMSCLAIPMRVKGRGCGTLFLFILGRTRDFTKEDLWLSNVFAFNIALAYNHFVLHKNSQAQAEQLKIAFKDLEASQHRLIQSSKMESLGQLAAGVAHEINNPMGGILGFADLMARQLREKEVEGGQKLKNYSELIYREALRCRVIVRKLLDFSRQASVRMERINLVPLLRQALLLVEHQAKMHNVVLREEDLEAGETCQVLADGSQIKQVFLNILINGIQSMPKGGKFRVNSAVLPSGHGRHRIRFSFIDEGVGIPSHLLKKIFDPFFTTKGTGHGTGLGLSVSFVIVEQHQGVIGVDSIEGKGSTFFVEFPVYEKGTESERDREETR